jgi:hypothetical protein
VPSSKIIQQLEEHVVCARRQYLTRFAVNTLAWLLILSAVLGVTFQSLFVGMLTLSASLLASIYGCMRSRSYRQITIENLLLHLNREFKELEESTELLSKSKDELNVLQTLQLSKVESVLTKLLNQKSVSLTPKYALKNGLIATLAATVLLVVLGFSYHQEWFDGLSLISGSHTDVQSNQVDDENIAESDLITPSITQAYIQVEPPSYVQQSKVNTDDLNLTVLSGSTVSWQLGFSHSSLNYQLHFGDDKELNLVKGDDALYRASETMTQTGIYSIGTSHGRIQNLYSITVVPDEEPFIRFITPKKTITEVAKNALPTITLEAIVGDDFGISKVDILASIAKGSGEAVKFRDEVFLFDETRSSKDGDIYSKTWNLTELGMEPGDEFYFSIRAWDNKTPVAQMTKSQTKIIRWLEDEQEGILSGGIVIDFIPEYFKSQRQIIIETQELIASEEQLSRDEFKQTSQSLGQAQNDLKQKYGQFLGDEFGEGGADVVSTEDDFEVHNTEEHEEEDHVNEDEHVHEEEATDDTQGLSGYKQIIAQYGHAHGEVDIGLITKQNPKAMMKRAIAAMWQAELHLLLSEPELALPFENEALSFLNKAKKAERIYVKRLGFEPPPVTEQRRYQGKLDDIENQQRLSSDDFDHAVTDNITQILGVINRHRSSQYTNKINTQEQALINDIKQLLLNNTANEPELIRHVATMEKALLGQSFNLDDCEHCLIDLEKRLWALISGDEAIPAASKKGVSHTQLSDRYLDLITIANGKPEKGES